MKSIVSLFILFFSLSVMAGGDGGSEEKTITTLQVVDASTGEPIIGADIHIEGFDEVLYTDPDGMVEIDHLVNSELEFRISYVSYEDATSTLSELTSTTVFALKDRQ